MKTAFINLALMATAYAHPALDKRQSYGNIASEFTLYGCRDVIFIFARGSTESGNIGTIVGPNVANVLKARYPGTQLAVQGVNYAAGLGTNFLPGGADPLGVLAMANLFRQVNRQCPDSIIVAGGYSQGAAVTHEAISNSGLSSAVINQIKGVVLFGDTQFLQEGGRIRGYPTANTKIYCAIGDLVCVGTLTITAAHLTYGINAPDAANFLAGRIAAAGG